MEVWLAMRVGTGSRSPVNTLVLRFRTSKRGISWVNGAAPKSGLGGAPVGTLLPPLACASPTNGFKPEMGARAPAVVNRPHFISSRRETFPWENALTISARFSRALSASLRRVFDEFHGR